MKDKLPNGVNHFAAKTLNAISVGGWESVLVNLLILFFFGVLTYIGYTRDIFILLLMSFPCFIGIFLAILYEIFLKIKDRFFPD